MEKRKIVIVLSVILILLILSIGGYFIYDKVIKKDTVKPEIILKGETPLIIPVNSKYEEAGYEVSDNRDEKDDIKVEIIGEVDTSKEGSYTLTYIATDTSGNKSQVLRTVIVEVVEKEISTFEVGDVINFSSKEWVVINKTEIAVGVILKDYLPSRIFCSDMDNIYSLTDEESLLYYLNEYFIKNLNEEKIINYNWEAGTYKNEKEEIVTAKVGLLTKKEYINLELNGIYEIFKVSGQAWWLLTPSEGEILNDSVNIITVDNTLHEGWINNRYAVKPVIYILNDTKVTE